MIVLDTNILSELVRPQPAKSVLRWIADTAPAEQFTTVVTRMELLYGIAVLAEGRRKRVLSEAITRMLEIDFAGRVLAFDSRCADMSASIAAQRRRIGHEMDWRDAQIAGIAASHDAEIATRNIADFADCGVALINPWEM